MEAPPRFPTCADARNRFQEPPPAGLTQSNGTVSTKCSANSAIKSREHAHKFGHQLKRAGNRRTVSGANTVLATKCCIEIFRRADFRDCRAGLAALARTNKSGLHPHVCFRPKARTAGDAEGKSPTPCRRSPGFDSGRIIAVTARPLQHRLPMMNTVLWRCLR